MSVDLPCSSSTSSASSSSACLFVCLLLRVVVRVVLWMTQHTGARVRTEQWLCAAPLPIRLFRSIGRSVGRSVVSCRVGSAGVSFADKFVARGWLAIKLLQRPTDHVGFANRCSVWATSRLVLTQLHFFGLVFCGLWVGCAVVLLCCCVLCACVRARVRAFVRACVRAVVFCREIVVVL